MRKLGFAFTMMSVMLCGLGCSQATVEKAEDAAAATQDAAASAMDDAESAMKDAAAGAEDAVDGATDEAPAE